MGTGHLEEEIIESLVCCEVEFPFGSKGSDSCDRGSSLAALMENYYIFEFVAHRKMVRFTVACNLVRRKFVSQRFKEGIA